MYYEGEGEDRKPVFEVGDSVRINAQDHDQCGFYGIVDSVDGDQLAIKAGWMIEESEFVKASQSQVEAN